jgi:hypothetical protein
LPDEAAALALVRHWSIVQIGEVKSSSFGQWQIRSKEFRENLEWVVTVPGDRETSPGVAQLLIERSARGVTIRRLSSGCWYVQRKEQRPSIASSEGLAKNTLVGAKLQSRVSF